MKIKKQSMNLGTAWEMIIIDDEGRELAQYRHSEQDIDRAIRSMRREIKNHLAAGGTLDNYQW